MRDNISRPPLSSAVFLLAGSAPLLRVFFSTGAVIANSLWSLFGISFSLAALYLSVVPFGTALSLAAALAIPVIWNLTVWVVHRRATFAVN